MTEPFEMCYEHSLTRPLDLIFQPALEEVIRAATPRRGMFKNTAPAPTQEQKNFWKEVGVLYPLWEEATTQNQLEDAKLMFTQRTLYDNMVCLQRESTTQNVFTQEDLTTGKKMLQELKDILQAHNAATQQTQETLKQLHKHHEGQSQALAEGLHTTQTTIDAYLAPELPRLIAQEVCEALAQQSRPRPELELGEAAGGGGDGPLVVTGGEPDQNPSDDSYKDSEED